ncbi:Crp/Fnr family transcriptional regulator [Antarcticirhabdus aurantiaca]|uniref:Crp/Fnr family transcriptional regulator n=1 Tax=Antarcticirhabdus aurantiaca TaxID=2606717 RepID=A0ACD4NKD3_9HYPH|nr:Crp/Fnr family transcriptional regulator [Antarcticirhabdus aurantiaca]WAJ27253.1 Crp/Fnr family transcriptional regulator [Jeongeuplla avenae]
MHSLPESRNTLLRFLSEPMAAAVFSQAEPFKLSRRQILHMRGLPFEHVYFIEHGVVSVIADVDGNREIEIWLVGHEGFIGLPLVLGSFSSPFKRVVSIGGEARRLPAESFQTLLAQHPELQRLMLRYAHSIAIQTGQALACATRHSVEQRLARWLLSAQDRLDGDVLPLTHSTLARLIGTRRASITVALNRMGESGLVDLRRGRIDIRNRDALVELSCKCYGIMRAANEAIYD